MQLKDLAGCTVVGPVDYKELDWSEVDYEESDWSEEGRSLETALLLEKDGKFFIVFALVDDDDKPWLHPMKGKITGQGDEERCQPQ